MTNPKLITTPFAENGDKNSIPETNTDPSNPQLASMSAGFPPITQQKISEGGIPPERDDFNGILNLYGQHIVHLNKGLPYEFDQSFANAIGGYPLNARLMLSNGDIVKSIVANNVNNPNIDMTGWFNEGTNVGFVESIADLLAINNPYHGQIVHAMHFDKPTGRLKGGGLFQFNSSKTNINDGGVCINGWERQLEDNVLNPFMFGAYGDFVPKAQEIIERQSGHNDAVAFQKMYNMNEYTIFSNISKLPPENKAKYTFEWGNAMFYLEDTLPLRSYQFTDCKGGKIFFNPIGKKHLFTTPRDEMAAAYQVSTGWNTQTICFATFKNGVIVGNVTRDSVIHADKCFDLGNPYKCVLDNMLVERFTLGVHLYPLDTSAWTGGERIGNFYENELRNVTVHECITGVINSANATHASNLTIGGGYIVGKEYTNKINYLLMNGGAGFSCTGFNIAPAHRQNMTNALIYDGCLGSSYSGGYTEWFDTLFDLELQDRFGGFNLQGSHIFKESTDVIARFKDAFSSFDPLTATRTNPNTYSNNQYLNTTGVNIGAKTELLTNFFKYVPQYDFKYGLYGVSASSDLVFDVKRFEAYWSGFTSKYGIRVLNFSTNTRSIKLPISNKGVNAQVAILYRPIYNFSAEDIKLNVLEFNGTNQRITVAENVFDYGNGWKMAVVKNINELVGGGDLTISLRSGAQVEIEHIGAYAMDGYPLMPIYAEYEPKINSDYDRLVDSSTSGGTVLEGDVTDKFIVVSDATVSPLSRNARACIVSGSLPYGIVQSTDVTVATFQNQVLFQDQALTPISDVGVGTVLVGTQGGVEKKVRVVWRNFDGTVFNRNLETSPVDGSQPITTGYVLFSGTYNIRAPLYANL
ncbi:hypothetical protein [Acinetobacter phage BUCT628]|nr:hypothetical protein [Acinetobacter phage BUCT628]